VAEALASALLGTLGILVLVYKRREVRPRRRGEATDVGHALAPGSHGRTAPDWHRPDLITRAARAIVRGHDRMGNAMGALVLAVVLVGAVFDPLVRWIVLATAGAMCVIYVAGTRWSGRSARARALSTASPRVEEL
jgi:hypothetical protein